MGFDYDGQMIIGCDVCDLVDEIEDVHEFADKNTMTILSPHYDCEPEYCTIGFSLNDIMVDNMDIIWLEGIKKKAEKFFKLTGTKAKLIGMQDIW